MVDKNDALLREVDEELRRERWEKLWERNGIYLIAAALLVVAVVGGRQIWDWRQASLAAEGGARYEQALAALDAGKSDDAEKALAEIANSNHDGYRSLAELQRAGRELKAGNPKNALAIFEALGSGKASDETIRNFARVQAASIRLSDADFTEIKNRLNDLAEGSTPWRVPAREIIGTAAVKAGKFEEARGILMPLLIDANLPDGARKRTELLLSMLAASELNQGTSAAAAPPAANAGPGPTSAQPATPTAAPAPAAATNPGTAPAAPK